MSSKKKFISKVKVVPQGQINCTWHVTFDDGTKEQYDSIDLEPPTDRNGEHVETYDSKFSDFLFDLWYDVNPEHREIGKEALYTSNSEKLQRLMPVTPPAETSGFVVGNLYTAESHLLTGNGVADEYAVLLLKDMNEQKLTFEVMTVEYSEERHPVKTNFVEGKLWVAPNNPAFLKAYKVHPLSIDA